MTENVLYLIIYSDLFIYLPFWSVTVNRKILVLEMSHVKLKRWNFSFLNNWLMIMLFILNMITKKYIYFALCFYWMNLYIWTQNIKNTQDFLYTFHHIRTPKKIWTVFLNMEQCLCCSCRMWRAAGFSAAGWRRAENSRGTGSSEWHY